MTEAGLGASSLLEGIIDLLFIRLFADEVFVDRTLTSSITSSLVNPTALMFLSFMIAESKAELESTMEQDH